jgi:hypothetical protein
MRAAKASSTGAEGPVELWDAALLPLVKKSPEFAKKFLTDLKIAKLTFGRRVHCPFLRPFFLTPEDEERVRVVSETIAAVAERVADKALEDKTLFEQFHLRPEEEKLVR